MYAEISAALTSIKQHPVELAMAARPRAGDNGPGPTRRGAPAVPEPSERTRMSDDDLDFRQPITLRDGRAALIRVMRPDDKDRLQTAFAKLDPQSIYTRFFSFRKELPERAFERIAVIDFVNLAGLVVTIGAGADETVIGGASYVSRTADDGAKVAEVAFTIEEDFQGQGLASKLLAALGALARRHGIVRFEAEVLPGNAPMLAVFQRCGLPQRRRREGGVVHLDFDLVPPAG
jgi:RimJ/RimL family protein N-acetyltransferase